MTPNELLPFVLKDGLDYTEWLVATADRVPAVIRRLRMPFTEIHG
jgi:hypothetical protein